MTVASSRLTQMFMALTLALGLGLASVQKAEARNGRSLAAGIALGVIGGAILAGEARRHRKRHRRHRRHRVRCYRGPRRCGYVGYRDCWINHHGARVCEGGNYRCWRPRYCD